MEHRIDDKHVCPGCGAKLNGATSLEDSKAPNPGDYSVCLYCTAFLVFMEELAMRFMTEEELVELPDEQRIALQRMRRAIKVAKEHS